MAHKRSALRNRADSATRQAILDATARIMREEGYAAVSSRRVAERAGLKSQLVHYYFGTMDELFLALFRHWDQESLVTEVRALTAEYPVRRLWSTSMESDKELVAEFIALAIHRKAIREELARANDRTRAIHTAVIAQALSKAGHETGGVPAEVLAFLVAAVSRTLLTETALGASAGHQAIRTFIEQQLRWLEPPSRAETRASPKSQP